MDMSIQIVEECVDECSHRCRIGNIEGLVTGREIVKHHAHEIPESMYGHFRKTQIHFQATRVSLDMQCKGNAEDCVHACTITYMDGRQHLQDVSAFDLIDLFWHLLTETERDHFAMY